MAGQLRLTSKASHPGDRNHLNRELSLAGIVVPDTRRPPGLARSEGIENALTASWRRHPFFPSVRLSGAKARLRAEARSRRRALAKASPDAGERAAANLPDEILTGARSASVYQPMGSEIDCGPLAARLAQGGARILLPVVVGVEAPLAFRAASGESAIPDLVIVPLLAFDPAGNRLGQGGGHYDRTLATLRATGPVLAVGLAFEGQRVDLLPHEPHDQRLDAILTEIGYRRFRDRVR